MQELNKIHSYIKNELREEIIARKTIEKIMVKLNFLKEFPLVHKLIRKTKNLEYRKFIIKNYIIIYKINLKKKEISILHIYNQKQKNQNKKIYSKL